MTIRPLAGFVVLTCSVALTHLCAAGRAGENITSAPLALTRPSADGPPIPKGEGGSFPPQYALPSVDRGERGETQTEISRPLIVADAWHTSFSKRLDESIAQLRADDGKMQNGAGAVTWGVGNGNLPPAVTSSATEKEDQAAMIARILRETGLPPALTSVVAVESAFNPLALSPKGARGLWQLMPATARRYGLTVAPHLDERTDPIRSTRAAAAYMKDLFAQFQDWPLALAAYNAGEDRVARAMTRTGAHDFWTLRQHGALPDETLHYVPAVLEKLLVPLDAPGTGPYVPPAASNQKESPGGRIAYATPAGHGN